ncbi:MAG: N-acetylmuramoyl-L-alanine amidase [Armatimonadetes bacterium]|nr:N-acetylmuramoyl-L-alanine amidase [Armatimonadota bacterium]
MADLIIDQADFHDWIESILVDRPVTRLLIHHTWSPSYKNFNGSNHLELQEGMRKFHTKDRGWADIGQHFSTFPDGKIVTGRSLEMDPACTKGANQNAICIENVGNFDDEGDIMTELHMKTIVEAAARVCGKWHIPVDADHVLYHHWFDLNSGQRNDGIGGTTKSCPGSNFFGGNRPEDAEAHFFPLIMNVLLP